MLAQTKEKNVLIVRMILFGAWCFLIFTLFYDPFSIGFTDPSNTSSPFRLSDEPVFVQGVAIPEEPYPMGARIFWTMLIPIIPLFLLVFGHEAWRRICPLSFASQLPRYLRFQRREKYFNRRNGEVERRPVILKAEQWLSKNFWYIQFGFLATGITGRLLFINSDRTALAAFLIFIIVFAIVVGYFFGGKSWCNYFCPIAPVQKIYTEPRGLLESKAQPEVTPLTQSTCRSIGNEHDTSACVGCQAPCPDVDLEKQYWETIFKPGRRLFYYGYLGLVFAFYFYYWVYSCNWRYYFSGAWTHEPDQLGTLFDPGVCLNEQVYDVPKIIAAPIVVSLCIAITYALGRTIETLYSIYREKRGKALAAEEVRHRIYTLFAFTTINTFYLFGGRPNLNLLPTPILWAVDSAIILLTSIWFFRTINRHFEGYKRESLLSSLLRQLKKLKIDYTKMLGGRKLEDLNADEAYILAKILPEFSGSQKLGIYNDILVDTLNNKDLTKAGAINALKEIRSQLSVTEDEHKNLIQEMGLEEAFSITGDGMNFGPGTLSIDDFDRLNSYQIALEFVIKRFVTQGLSVRGALESREVQVEIERLTNFYSITEEEHKRVINALVGDQKIQIRESIHQFNAVIDVTKNILAIEGVANYRTNSTLKLMRSFLSSRREDVYYSLLKALSRLGDYPESLLIVHYLHVILGDELRSAIHTPSRISYKSWMDSLSPKLRQITDHPLSDAQLTAAHKEGEYGEVPKITVAQLESHAPEAVAVMRTLANDKDPILKAAALTALAQYAREEAKQLAHKLSDGNELDHWLTREIGERIIKGESVDTRKRNEIMMTTITVRTPEGTPIVKRFFKPRIKLGLSHMNDVSINHHQVAAEHLELEVTPTGAQLHNLESGFLFINDDKTETKNINLQPNSEIQIGSYNSGPTITIDWAALNEIDDAKESSFRLLPTDTYQMMLHLFESDFFNHLLPEVLVEIARQAELREYDENTYVFRSGDPSNEIFLLVAGRADVILRKSGKSKTIDSIPPGQTLGELGIFTKKERSANILTTEKNTKVITIDGEYFLNTAGFNTNVASNFLKMISARQQHILSRVS